jgi:hypothetical protein
VQATVDPSHPDILTPNFAVTMAETGQGTRDAIASQKYIDAANASLKQQQIQKGDQQAAPKL